MFPGLKLATVIWGSQRVLEQLEWYQTKKETHRGQFVKKLLRYAETGFAQWQGADRPIRHEWDQVFRIGDTSNLFRVIGFYGAGNHAEFIALDAYLKSGTKLSAAERERIDRVSDVRAKGAWRKVEQ